MTALSRALIVFTGLALGADSQAKGDGPARGNRDATAPRITKETQQVIDSGLAYFGKQPADDGAWGTRLYKRSVGVTSPAGRAFLSAGHRPGQGAYGATIAKALGSRP